MNRQIAILYWLLAISAGTFVLLNAGSAPLSRFHNLAQSMLDIASLVFAVLGGWLALFFPDDFAGLFGKKKQPAFANPTELKVLLISLALSGVAALISLVIVSVAPYVDYFRASFGRQANAVLSGFALFACALCLSYALLSAIAPAAATLLELKREARENERRRRMERPRQTDEH